MHPIIKNILAVLAGLLLGNIVNGSLIFVSGSIIPPPSGFDNTTIEGLNASMHLMEPKHFLFPFLAHALGTLSGAFITAFLAANNHLKLALIIGVLFLIGGISMVYMLPSPLWFSITDLVFAYIPMAFLGWKLSKK